MLTDGDRIRNLLGTYCERIDAGDFAGVGELFARGALAAGDGPPFVRGATDVAAFYAAGTRLHDGSPRTKHVVADTVLAEPDADGVVVARSSYVVFQATDALPLQPIITGRYLDRFATDGTGVWHFVERRFSVDQVGELALTRSVAPKHAMELLLTGDLVSAVEAERIGLVNRTVPDDDLAQAVADLAAHVASKSPVAVAIGKEAFWRQRDLSLVDAYGYASSVMAANLATEDAAEGIGAFLEKRSPRWVGR